MSSPPAARIFEGKSHFPLKSSNLYPYVIAPMEFEKHMLGGGHGQTSSSIVYAVSLQQRSLYHLVWFQQLTAGQHTAEKCHTFAIKILHIDSRAI